MESMYPIEPPVSDVHAEFLHSLRTAVIRSPPTFYPPEGLAFGGLYRGPTSVAYLFLQLSLFYPNLRIQGRHLREWCIEYLSMSACTVHLVMCSPHDCGISNELLAYTTLMAIIDEDPELAKRLCSYASLVITNTGREDNGWLNGRAGYLYLLLRTRAHFQNIGNVFNAIEETIKLVTGAMFTPRNHYG